MSFLAGEGHFQVELGEFWLAVGAEIFVAKTFHDLEVAVESANHEDLLEDLRRLRESVELAVMHATGHEIVAGAFGCGASEHGVSTSMKPISSITLRISRRSCGAARCCDGAWRGGGRCSDSGGAFLQRRWISSSTGNGGVLALLRMCRLVATSSISPVASSGLDFWRLITWPSTATTNSPRACSALAWAAGCVSLLKTTWTMPVRSRMSRKRRLPRSRRRWTQPLRWRCCRRRRRGERRSSGCVLGCRENLARWWFPCDARADRSKDRPLHSIAPHFPDSTFY